MFYTQYMYTTQYRGNHHSDQPSAIQKTEGQIWQVSFSAKKKKKDILLIKFIFQSKE